MCSPTSALYYVASPETAALRVGGISRRQETRLAAWDTPVRPSRQPPSDNFPRPKASHTQKPTTSRRRRAPPWVYASF